MTGQISAFVISYNRADILRATLTAARFADELIVVDKSSTDGSRGVATGIADRVVCLPWSPTVEGTRAEAESFCSHEWIVCLDDDEILSPACAGAFRQFINAGLGDVLRIPIKHHILGRHDDRAHYAGQYLLVLHRRGALTYTSTVHQGVYASGRQLALPDGADAFVTHLSHPDIASFIEKTNRYTAQFDRAGLRAPDAGIGEWAKGILSRRLERVPATPYLETVSVLKAVYDIIDGLKRWEETQPDGHQAFAGICAAVIEGAEKFTTPPD